MLDKLASPMRMLRWPLTELRLPAGIAGCVLARRDLVGAAAAFVPPAEARRWKCSFAIAQSRSL
jgi:hypothetical protein